MIMSPSFLSVQNPSVMQSWLAGCDTDKCFSPFRPLCVGAWSDTETTSQPWSMTWAVCLWPVPTLCGRAALQPGREPSLWEGWGKWTRETLTSMRVWPRRMMTMRRMRARNSGGIGPGTSTVRPIPPTWAWRRVSLCNLMGFCPRPRPPMKLGSALSRAHHILLSPRTSRCQVTGLIWVVIWVVLRREWYGREISSCQGECHQIKGL